MRKTKTKKPLFLDELNKPNPQVQAAAAAIWMAWTLRVAERMDK